MAVNSQRRRMLLFLSTNMAAMTSLANHQYSPMQKTLLTNYEQNLRPVLLAAKAQKWCHSFHPNLFYKSHMLTTKKQNLVARKFPKRMCCWPLWVIFSIVCLCSGPIKFQSPGSLARFWAMTGCLCNFGPSSRFSCWYIQMSQLLGLPRCKKPVKFFFVLSLLCSFYLLF